MAFEKRDFRQLYETLAGGVRERVPEVTDFSEGSVVRSLLESFAYELGVLYEQMDGVYRSGFVDTATGPSLDRVVAVLGITRNEPDFATGEVTFRRDAGSADEIVIPVGTLVTTLEDPSGKPPRKAYLTVEEGRLAAGETAVEVKVQAEEPGGAMTSEAETLVVMPRPVPGVKAVYNRRPIRFVGRERESDEELRARAKKALLASGRASATAIENALLGRPGVRGVRLREEFGEGSGETAGTGERLGRGVVAVYVDGLTPDNAAELRARVDEVRAAGVYVVLEPAVKRLVEATLRIVPDARLDAAGRAALERQVQGVVVAFLDRLRMGEPLLFTQLTREVLNVKGVTDLAEFRLDTFREARSAAVGTLTLTRGAAHLGRNLTIEARTALRTATGQEFVVAAEVPFPSGGATLRVPVRAALFGRDGELRRTGGAAGWEPIAVDGVPLAVSNDAPLLLPREEADEGGRRVEAGFAEHFVPERVRVAAEEKELAVQVQARVALPGAAAQEAVVAALRTRVARAQRESLPAAEMEMASDATRKRVTTLVEDFYATVKAALAGLRDRAGMVLGLDAAARDALVRVVEDYFEGARGTRRVVEEELRVALEARLRALAAERPLEARLRERLAPALGALLAERAAAYPRDAVEQALRAGVETLGTQVREEAARLELAAAALRRSAERLAAREITQAAYDTERKALEDRQRVFGELQVSHARLADGAARDADALRDQGVAALLAVGEEPALEAATAGRVPPDAFDLDVRLRTVTEEGAVLADAPYLQGSFVERPVARVVFVFSRQVELAGALELALPLTATDAEREGVRAAVRQALADWIDGLAPEENPELDRIRAVAEEHDQVMRAVFTPAASLEPRIQRGAVRVDAFEKLVLGGPATFEVRA